MAGGEEDLSTLFFGGAGGEGGADEDGGYPGPGGNGGGVVLVWGSMVHVAGSVTSAGADGGMGANCTCGGGSGMGNGGAGAGGSIGLFAKTVDIEIDAEVSAPGGVATRGCNTCGNGGAGGAGRVLLKGDFITGTSTPEPATDETGVRGAGTGTWSSAVIDSALDGGRVETLTWEDEVPAGTTVIIEARAADEPFAADSGRPAWAAIESGPQSALSGRYLQVRASMTATEAGTPSLSELSILVHGRPTVELGELPGGLSLKVGDTSVPLDEPEPGVPGELVTSDLDLTAAVNVAVGAVPGNASVEVSTTGAGRLRYQLRMR